MTGGTFGNWYNIWLYGSNSATDFNDISDINVSGNMILLYTQVGIVYIIQQYEFFDCKLTASVASGGT